jgi:hypothetical protein
MRKYLLALLFAVLVAFPAFAQEGDDIIDPVALTAEPTTEAVATVEAGGVVINVEAPDTPAPATQDDGLKIVAAIGWIGFLLVVMALGYALLLLMRELRKSAAAGDQAAKNLLGFITATQNMLPVDEVLKMVDGLDKRAKETPVPGEIDDTIVATIRATVYEILGKELPDAPSEAG